MNSRVIELYWGLASFAALAGVFIVWPDLDLAVSSLFARNDWSWLADRGSRWIELPYRALPYFGRFLIGSLLCLWLATFIPRLAAIRRLRLLFAFLFCSALLGPVLLVDAGLKDHIGRARPAQVEQFGGSRQFSPAFVPSDQCDKNCSFVSGHVATTAFIMAAGWLGSPFLRRRWLLASMVAAGAMGVVRMSVGGHFLSDCIFAWFATYFGLWLVHAAFARLSRLEQVRDAFAAVATGLAEHTGRGVARSAA
ncbi:MAG: phosphatase PAP2 family protein [Dechloromonas sp.]|nr:phosphatase PAP2 family protein [Dechloromonas sp.]